MTDNNDQPTTLTETVQSEFVVPVKSHWTKTPEGKAKLSQSIKAGYEKKRKSVAAKKAWKAKKAAAKANGAGTHVDPVKAKSLTVTITGPDAYLAMSELLSYHYKITMTVSKG